MNEVSRVYTLNKFITMKHAYVYSLFAIALFASLAASAPVQAEVASSTATSTVVAATTTVATTTATTTPVVIATTTATGTVASTSHIADLLAQLAKLTALFNDLKAKLFGVQAQIAEVKAGLHEGVQGEDVKSIQELLASDPSIYPAGLKTGYFGPMTVEAIKRFQTKNGLEVTGTITPETKAALDTLMAQRHSEGHFPFGLLIAPGQHRDEFEHRIKAQCAATSTVATASSTTAVGCKPLIQKYHLEDDDTEDEDHMASSTLPWRGQSMNQNHGGGNSNH